MTLPSSHRPPPFRASPPLKCRFRSRLFARFYWSAANGGLRDGGLSKSQDIRGKRNLFGPSGKGPKRQKKAEKGPFRPISRTGGQTPLKPPFVTPPFAAAQFYSFSTVFGQFWSKKQPESTRNRLPLKGLLRVLGGAGDGVCGWKSGHNPKP